MDHDSLERVKAWRWLHQAVGWAATIGLILTVALVFCTVLMRYVFKLNIYGSDELITLVTMWMYFFGAIYCSFEESHLQGDLLSTFWRKGWHWKGQKLFIYGFSILVLGYWCVWGSGWMQDCFASNRRTTGLHIPFWANQLPIVVGLYGMILFSIYHFIRNIFKKSELYELEAEEKKKEEERLAMTLRPDYKKEEEGEK